MMIGHRELTLFVAGALALLIVPGPAVTYIVSRSVGQGRAAGLVSAMGIATGTFVHVAAATLGLTALLVSSAVAFEVVRYAGAAYLVYLGVRLLRSKEDALVGVTGGERRLSRIYGQGVLVNVLNPKTAVFFLAFLPQFVDPVRGHAGLQIFELGVLFAVMGWCSDSVWALAAGSVAERIRESARLRRAQKNISGGALIALGVASAVAGGRSK
jgi:threonine/homoserine/homoserine lactone efflux protein